MILGDAVQGRCPWCGAGSLFLGSGGFITCSLIGCPNPTGITDLLDGERDHIVRLEHDTFSIQHPLRERLEGELFDCGLHAYIAGLDGPPRQLGRYRVMQVTDSGPSSWWWSRVEEYDE